MIVFLLIYDLILILAIPLYIVLLVIKGKFTPGVFDRLKAVDSKLLASLKNKDIVWIHAVSLGEVATAKQFLEIFKQQLPQQTILITTITSTGKLLAQRISQGNVFNCYLPFDISFLIKSFITQVNPRMLILMETELWPNLLYYAAKNKIPTLVMNGRLSDRSFKKYFFFSWFMRRMARDIRMFCVQSQLDRERIIKLGVLGERVKITGNMKFDALIDLDQKQRVFLDNLRKQISLQPKDCLIVAGSTHAPEEQYMLDMFLKLKTEFKTLRLLIAPRHLERLNSIEQIIQSRGLKYERISEITAANSDSILLLDTVGSLLLIYSLADIVFVGGSLSDTGGHNILEPAFFRKPIVIGPHMYNFRAMTQLFLEQQALIQVRDSQDLIVNMRSILADKEKLRVLGEAAGAVVSANQGATLANMEIIKQYL